MRWIFEVELKDGDRILMCSDGLTDMLEDEERTLWICTDGGGINCLNRKSGEFNYYTASDPGSILHNNVKTIAYRWKARVYLCRNLYWRNESV